jgi:hypothetical protein
VRAGAGPDRRRRGRRRGGGARGGLEERLRLLVEGMRALGFGRALLERRDAAMECTASLAIADDAAHQQAMTDVRITRMCGGAGCGSSPAVTPTWIAARGGGST